MLDIVATFGLIDVMVKVSLREAKNKWTELVRRVERGETIIVTRNGKAVMEISASKYLRNPVKGRRSNPGA